MTDSLSIYKKVKWSRYRPGVAQRLGWRIALLFHGRGTRRGWWMVSSTPRPHFTPGKDAVPILQEAGWAPGPVWTSGKYRPHQDSIPDRLVRSQSLYRLSYPAHLSIYKSPYNGSQQDALILNFILISNSTCIGQTYCPSSGVLTLYSQQLVFVVLVMVTVC